MRSLSAEEAALWAKVTATIRPLSRDPVDPDAPEAPAPAVAAVPKGRVPPPRPVHAEPKRAITLQQSTLDGSWDRRLRTGRLDPDRILDLHGHTRDEARAALVRYLSVSLQQGFRCIRVIHGKGLGSPGRFSILKELSRGWLAQREEILAFCQAGPNDGGSGALLVLLRAQQRPRDQRP